MSLDIVQISNIFNILAQLDPKVLNYHFGWPEDINKNIDNNFDSGQSTGKLFPAIQMFPPEGELYLAQGKNETKVTVYFLDLHDYENDSSAKTLNLIEQWRDLKSIAYRIIKQASVYFRDQQFIIKDDKFEWVDSHAHNDRLIQVGCEFTLIHHEDCVIPEPDFDQLPVNNPHNPVGTNDYERLIPETIQLCDYVFSFSVGDTAKGLDGGRITFIKVNDILLNLPNYPYLVANLPDLQQMFSDIQALGYTIDTTVQALGNNVSSFTLKIEQTPDVWTTVVSNWKGGASKNGTFVSENCS